VSIGIGIIGCGAITQRRHAPEYNENPDCTVKAFCDPLLDRAEKLLGIYGGYATDDYMKLLKDKKINAVSVCTSNATHAKVTIDALNAGKHVLCEKPMAVTLDEAEAMVKAAKINDKLLMIGHNQRFFPAHVKAKNILDSGVMGKVITFKTSFKHAGPESWVMDKEKSIWFYNKNTAAFGVIADLGIHKIDLVRWLLGEDIVEVSAAIGTLDKKYETGEMVEVDDNAVCILWTKSGILGTAEVSWTNYGTEDNSTVLYCEKGVLSICTEPDYDLIGVMKDGTSFKHMCGGISTNQKYLKSGVIDSFISAVNKVGELEVSGDEGYKSMKVVFACVEAAKKCSAIRIDLPQIGFEKIS
jgi:UDP-N-acetylglucosamine 3-dehydrogenase